MWQKITVVMAAVCCFAAAETKADGFLTLPLTVSTATIANGWYYKKTARRAEVHYATDYRTVDGQQIVAACDGVAIATESWTDSGFGSYGYFTLQRCNDLAPDGSHYMVIYAHLERSSEHIVSKSRYDTDYATWTPVRRGDLVGYAGQTGTTWPHVHFEIFTGNYANKMNHRVDPYNLYGLASIYPGDGRGSGSTGYLWLTFPPAAPRFIDRDRDGYNMLEDCDDNNPNVYPGARELCNGRDDDCDGILDNWAALDTPCAVEPVPGCRRSGTWVCSEDEATIVCNADATVGVERCNNLDDDCDGLTDEDWRAGLATDLGQPCEVGLGECRRSGTWECEPAGRGVVCDADYVSGTPEVCDGLDNDCDGYIDDFCLCEVTYPHSDCLCRECDASCPSGFFCLVISLSPFTHGCYWRGGCYGCPGWPGIEDWVCARTLSCVEYVELEFCLAPEAAFCARYCPWPY
jgi:hypothetical protein